MSDAVRNALMARPRGRNLWMLLEDLWALLTGR